MSWMVGIDTGGTFTDLAALDAESGRRYITKVPSTPARPADAILDALHTFTADCETQLGDVDFFGHGTTVGTNAVLEGKGADSGLLITKGFNAIYEVRGGIRPGRVELVDPRYQKPRPLIPLSRTRYVDERIGYDGSVVRALDEDSVRQAVRELRAQGVTSIAVMCLFSFVNPKHEERIERDRPRGASGLPRVAVEPRPSGDPRVRPALDHRARRLRRPGRGRLLRRARAAHLRRRPDDEPGVRDAVQRGAHANSPRAVASERASAVRPAGRRLVRAAPRPAHRRAQHHHRRHGRYQHRRVGHPQRRGRADARG